MKGDLVRLSMDERHGVVVVRVTGELDLAGAPHVEREITEGFSTAARGLVLDFSELEFIDSSGIALLFTLARRLGGRRQELRLVAPEGGPVARVLEIVEFDRAAPVHGELEEAIAHVGG